MKMHTRPSRASLALVLFSACAFVLGFGPKAGAGLGAQPVTTPPPPPTPGASALPTLAPTSSPTPAPSRKRGRVPPPEAGPTATPAPTATPTSPAFSTLDGSWEVQVQRIDRTTYSRFEIRQTASILSGSWVVDKVNYPLEGTFDGRLFRMSVKLPAGAYALNGYVENSTDMVGVLDNGKGEIPFVNPIAFTAEHRAPYNPLGPVDRKKKK
ncbi:MAG: hypothetical protein ABI346_09840 [Candidatus Baltobacteraceae bacterium]